MPSMIAPGHAGDDAVAVDEGPRHAAAQDQHPVAGLREHAGDVLGALGRADVGVDEEEVLEVAGQRADEARAQGGVVGMARRAVGDLDQQGRVGPGARGSRRPRRRRRSP
jgi:hypothetical protein